MFIYSLYERDLNRFICEKGILMIVITTAKYDYSDFIMYYVDDTDSICDTYIILFPLIM